MTTRSDLEAGIEPGSMPHGERANLEAGLAGALAQQPGQAPGGGGALPPAPDSADPLSALLNGDVDPGPSDAPVTAGLSVGPGAGPEGTQAPIDPVQARLQTIAMQAKSPLIRQMARNELRRLVGERV